LNNIVELMAGEGIELIIEEFNDFQTPNIALADGDILANFFQHRPFLDNFNYHNNSNLVPVFGVHFEPLRLYAGRLDDLNHIPQGAEIAIPNDPTNEARALQLLEALGLITLHQPSTLASSTTGIASNPHGLVIHTMTAQSLPAALPDVDFAVINGNVALQGGVIYRAIDGAGEDPQSPAAYQFTNFVVVREGYQNDHRIIALINALNSQATRDFINTQYQGRVVYTLINP